MKPKHNWGEIEGKINFNEVSQKLTAFTASGGGRRKTVHDLLEKVKEPLLQARSNGASYQALSAFLKASGLPISEASLRQYLNAQGAGKRVRAKRSASKRAEPTAHLPPESQSPKREPAQPQPVQPAQPASVVAPKLEPQPIRDTSPTRNRGPRIADPKNL